MGKPVAPSIGRSTRPVVSNKQRSKGKENGMSELHKALKLPSTYRVIYRVQGRVTHWPQDPKDLPDRTHIEAVILGSETPGMVRVYAVRLNWGIWWELTKDEWSNHALKIIEAMKLGAPASRASGEWSSRALKIVEG